MNCHYCDHFNKIPKSLRKLLGNPGKPKKSYRYCRIVHKEVTSDTKACPELEPTTYFWCRKWKGWIHIITCLARRKKRFPSCSYCKQYREIEYVIVGRDMFALFSVKRRKIVPIKTQNKAKPILKRRRENVNGDRSNYSSNL